MTRCATCDADDELLFTCGHCHRRFCASHQFPHHACTRFSHRGTEETARGETAAVEFGDDGTGTGPGTADAPNGAATGERGAVGTTGTHTDQASDGPAAAGAATDRSGPATDGRRTVPGPRVEVARDAARETRPDREGPLPAPPARGMPWERGDPSVTEWMREQTYPSYLLKVGGLSLLLTTSYYGGLAVTLFGYV